MLAAWRAAGFHAAIVKLGLDQATLPDSSSGDPAWDHVTDVPGDNPKAPLLPQEISKGAALGMKDLLFFETMLGQAGAKDLFHGIEQQMTGRGGGTHATWTPQGLIPRPSPRGAAALPVRSGPPSPPTGIVSSAPPPLPGLRR